MLISSTIVITIIFSIFFSEITSVEVLNPYSKALNLLIQREPPTNFTLFTEKNFKDVEEFWITQKVDHFSENARNNESWSMRFLCNAKYFKPYGPLFIFVGGEWEISPWHLLTGLMHDLAQQHGGMLYYTEHRFYGHSWPRSNTSTESLVFLSAHQALADLEHFIKFQKAHNPDLKHSKVILIGGSYSGTLVAWFMQRYPNIADVAWASSAPMRAKLDFHEYLEVTGQSIRQQGGERCYKHIALGMSALERMFRDENKLEELMNRLHVCRNFNITRQLDVSTFFNGIHNYFAALVQSYSTRIAEMCLSLTSMDPNPGQAFVKYLHYVFWTDFRTPMDNEFCFDFTFEAMRALFTDVQDKISGSRPWFYQTCNEFGWFTTATSTARPGTWTHPFATQVPLTFFQHLCQVTFGAMSFTLPQLIHRIAKTNEHFVHIANHASDGTSKVFYTHGQLDPWRAVGLQVGRHVIVIPGYSHTADLGSINLTDGIDLNIAKLKVAAFLQRTLH